MTDETKVELMKIAASLTRDAVDHLGKGVVAGPHKANPRGLDIKDVFAECLSGVRDQFEKLGQ